MKTLGILLIKSESKRFPRKNFAEYKGKPLWELNKEALISSNYIDKLVVCSDRMQACCNQTVFTGNGIKRVESFWQPLKATGGDSTLVQMLRYAYLANNQPYDAIVTVFAGSVGNTAEDVNKAIKMLEEDPELQEVRAFNKHGKESGVIALRRDRLLEGCGNNISSHIGMILNNGQELHYEGDLKDWRIDNE